MTTDLEIARATRPRPLAEVASELGVSVEALVPYGHDKAKLRVDPEAPTRGRLVLVSAITPTPAGEGKTTVSVALADGLRRLGTRACVALREPSLGPVLGAKGGATGGGRSQVIPMEDINLHFTGDLHAVTSAHNTLAAMIDNHLHRGNELGLEPRTVRWPRVLDVGDRALRHVIVGLGGRGEGVPRETGFHITAASEVMAILCLARDAADLRSRLGRIVVGRRHTDGEAITADHLEAAGAMAALLRDAMLPNLVQTLEGTPALVHGGPFANIAQGTSSLLATRAALAHAEVVVTEAGFGFDLGGEKFLDLKAPAGGLAPEAIVLVATVRALKAHAGRPRSAWSTPEPDAVRAGLPNLMHHVRVASSTGVPVVVALNAFDADSSEEQDVVRAAAEEAGVAFAICDGFARGGEGATALASAVLDVARPTAPRGFQTPGASARDNLDRVCREVYGAPGAVLSPDAERDWHAIEALGLDTLPVCVAKSPLSLRGGASGAIPIQGIEIAAGAGFLVPWAGRITRMPGMPRVPNATRIHVGEDGAVEGLS